MNQNNQRSKDRGRPNSRRRRRPNKNRGPKAGADPQQANRPPAAPKNNEPKPIPKRYGVVFYDNFQQAKDDGPQLLDKAKEVDQLNIVIKAEGNMDDPVLLQYGKLYAGEAWHLIHQRRLEEGWYNEPH